MQLQKSLIALNFLLSITAALPGPQPVKNVDAAFGADWSAQKRQPEDVDAAFGADWSAKKRQPAEDVDAAFGADWSAKKL